MFARTYLSYFIASAILAVSLLDFISRNQKAADTIFTE